ncbi:hypothetical protein ACGFWE_22705 [Streptomyces sp. NPDC048523]|uniref:hypothetical protein n=1 Tax=Streptomyces sp. NPDC048523 TaxID=3365567 RepID=UPI0037212FDC
MTGNNGVGLARAVARLPLRVLGVLAGGTDVLTRRLVTAVVDRIDLDDVVSRVDVNKVADRVDIARVADRVDVNRIAARIDVDDIAGRMDVDRIAARIDLDGIAGRMDVNRIADRIDVDRVARRLDVDAVAGRIDVDAVIARVDLVPLTLGVLTQIDLGRIVKDTGGGMAQETIDAVRVRGLRGDRLVNRVTDRLLRRTGLPEAPTEMPTPP